MPRAGWEPAGAGSTGSTGSTGSRDGQGLVRPLRAPRRCIHLPPSPSHGGTLLGVGDSGVPTCGSGCALGVASPARREGTKPRSGTAGGRRKRKVEVASGKQGAGSFAGMLPAQRFHGWELQKAFMARGGEAP